MKRFFLVVCALAAAVPARAQTPPNTPADAGTTNVEVDPIRCWWRTSSGAVRIGEHFELWLTCAALETDAVQVVPDQSHLGVEVAALAPFEVVGGSHPADLRSGSRRFFQYQYILRIINPDAIGKDIKIPDTVIHYKVNSRVAANTSIQGRDLTYVLPPEEVRVASMVPADAADIRDSSGESFSIVDSLGLRAGVLEILAITCVALGALMLIFVLVRVARRGRQRTPADERLLSTRQCGQRRDSRAHGPCSATANSKGGTKRSPAAPSPPRGLPQPPRSAARSASASWRRRRATAPAALCPRGRFAANRARSRVLSRRAISPGARRPIRDFSNPVDELRESIDTFSQAQYGRATAIDQSRARLGAVVGDFSRRPGQVEALLAEDAAAADHD